MQVVFAQEPLPTSVVASIFLAGPSPRDNQTASWRTRALDIIERSGFEGHVFVPLPRDGVFGGSYIAQAEWEQDAQDMSDVILFWVARDIDKLPGFTTNVEFGQRVAGKNVVLGCPVGAPKTRFLDYLARKNFVESVTSLEGAIDIALGMIGSGAAREGGECKVPLHIWRLPHFASWLDALKAAGNRLDGAKVELAFGVGPQKRHIIYWALHANVFVAAENRNKTNEIVIGRPDTMHIVAYYRDGDDPLDTKTILVREFRSTANTEDGFIREVPGGSSLKKQRPKRIALDELFEETGIVIEDEDRLVEIPARQAAGTIVANKAHLFALELAQEEIADAERRTGTMCGNHVTDSEQTYVEVRRLRELVEKPVTDWSNLGMIFTALFGRFD